METVVFANKGLDSSISRVLGYHPVFSMGTYDLPPGNGPWPDLWYLYAQALVYSYDLRKALAVFGPFDFVFCHTVGDFELMGWLWCARSGAIRGDLAVLQRLTPGFAACSRWKRHFHPYWRIKPHYLTALHRTLGPRFHLLTDSEILSQDYAAVYPYPITTLPIPLGEVSSDSAGPAPRDGQVRVGYMGDAREAKGFPLLPDLVRRVFNSGRQGVCFVIHCPDTEYRGEAPHRGVQELEAIAASDHRVLLIRDRLDGDAYVQLMNSLDIVVFPYTDPHFREATSNVFAETVALGKVSVVPANTWMARELLRSGGGVQFRTGDVQDLAERLLEAVDRYGDLASKAQAFAPSWRKQHNANSLADALLGLVQGNRMATGT